MLPPEDLERAKEFCFCHEYQTFNICVYAGGGSIHQHDMYWAYIIYDREGSRRHYDRLGNDCLDVADGINFCQNIIDRWVRGICYEDIYLWRSICEFMNSFAQDSVFSSNSLVHAVEGCAYLIGYDRTHREHLWKAHKIQLIIWDTYYGGEKKGWRLKGNWEDKIDFLEQVYILNRNPDTLPRPWLDKWEKKVRSQELYNLEIDLIKHLELIPNHFRLLKRWVENDFDVELLRSEINQITRRCSCARENISKLNAIACNEHEVLPPEVEV